MKSDPSDNNVDHLQVQNKKVIFKTLKVNIMFKLPIRSAAILCLVMLLGYANKAQESWIFKRITPSWNPFRGKAMSSLISRPLINCAATPG